MCREGGICSSRVCCNGRGSSVTGAMGKLRTQSTPPLWSQGRLRACVGCSWPRACRWQQERLSGCLSTSAKIHSEDGPTEIQGTRKFEKAHEGLRRLSTGAFSSTSGRGWIVKWPKCSGIGFSNTTDRMTGYQGHNNT